MVLICNNISQVRKITEHFPPGLDLDWKCSRHKNGKYPVFYSLVVGPTEEKGFVPTEDDKAESYTFFEGFLNGVLHSI